MNEDLTEKWGRGASRLRQREAPGPSQVHVLMVPSRLNTRIREYYEQPPAEGGYWLSRPEIPTTAEVLDTDTNSSASSSDVVEISPNRREGAFESTEDYLSTHYELLREDAVRPLREAISALQRTPHATEEAFNGKIGIYEKTHICGLKLAHKGIAHRVTFSLRRTGKKILWEQSKRLITGSLVALTPASDMFAHKVIVATVASRAFDGVQQNPSELDLFFARTEEYEIDPTVEYVMIEARNGFYEAHRHTMLALQHMMKEPFPMSKHLVDVERAVPMAKYVTDQPRMDLRSVLINNKHATYENVDIIASWPQQPQSDLDASQLEALRRILTKQLAIVQGPPGTGKTHVSVQAIKVMLANRARKDEPPIIIACQTNHAVDQILRQIALFEPDFARLGGRSKDRDVIKQRTLYELRNARSGNPPAGNLRSFTKEKFKRLQTEVETILTPLMPERRPLNHRTLEDLGILTKAQADSLEQGASRWVQHTESSANETRNPFFLWLGDKLVSVPVKQQPEEFGFDFEEADLEFEQLKDIEAENAEKDDDDDKDRLAGKYITLADNFTCRNKVTSITERKVSDALKEQDMWNVSEAYRGAIYRCLQTQLKQHVLNALRTKAKEYEAVVQKRRIGLWECDEPILKSQRIIGMTTTGLSKYRPLLTALQPKIVLIEEAAETLEAPVTVACMPSVQKLILVGDHQQLRPHTQVRAHENKPYYLNISMFERLVNNSIEFTTLVKQRRMIPEVRRLLYPIYKNLIQDHKWVLDPANRPDVPGMGGVNSFFFTHQWSEARDDQMSSYNPMEASMICGFVRHLHYNGVELEDITVLTFYNGQRKRILSELRQTLEGQRVNVFTVDSYQGEENKVVILSMTRSNEKNQIGFLDDTNRVCVALSRAQRGFYIFGNGMLFFKTSKTWETVLKIMSGKKNKESGQFLRDPCRLGQKFPIRCAKHDRKIEVEYPEDWSEFFGGCDEVCRDKLPCGHPCDVRCHPFSHDLVNCLRCPAAPTQRQASASLEAALSRSESTSTDTEPKRVAGQMTTCRHRPGSSLDSGRQAADLGENIKQMSLGGAMVGHPSTRVTQGDGTRLKWKETYRVGEDGSASKKERDEVLIDLD